MFDTVKLHIDIQLSRDELESISWNKSNSTEDHSYSGSKTIFKHYHKHDNEPRLIYRFKEGESSKASLKVELSIPKFLYGNNVEEFREEDIPLLMERLRQYIASALKLPLNRIPDIRFVETEKLHVCCNFNAGGRKEEYLKSFANVQRHNYRLNALGDYSSVYWEAKTRREKMYDKEKEIINESKRKKKVVNQQLVDKAKGILRYEVEISDYELRSKSPRRFLGELLDFEWAINTLHKGLSKIGASNLYGNTSFSELIRQIDNSATISSDLKNNLIAFVTRYRDFGEKYCRGYYSTATFYRLMKILKSEFGISKLSFSDIALPPLNVKQREKFSFWKVKWELSDRQFFWDCMFYKPLEGFLKKNWQESSQWLKAVKYSYTTPIDVDDICEDVELTQMKNLI